MNRSVTIAVCTRNRADALRRALRGVSRLIAPQGFSIRALVVDNGSTDHTNEVVAAWRHELPCELEYVREPIPGVARARNRAVQVASGDWLAFLDDDEVPQADWLSELLDCARRRSVRGVGGAVRVRFLGEQQNALGPFCRRLFGDTSHQLRERPFDRGFQPGAGNLMIHRSLWHVPFETPTHCDPCFAQRGEDSRWFATCRRHGEPLWYTPTAVVDHWIPRDRTTPHALRRLCGQSAQGADLTWGYWGRWTPLITLARWWRLSSFELSRCVVAQLSGSSPADDELRFRWELYRVLAEVRSLRDRHEQAGPFP